MYANGICNVSGNIYNKMIRFSDISYQLSHDETKQMIFAQYCSFLNSFDHRVDIQFCFINYRIDDKAIQTDFEQIKEYSNVESNEFELMKKEYFGYLEEQKRKGTNGIVRNKYLIFSVKDDSYDNAVRRLENIYSNIETHFKAIGVFIEELNGIDRLSIINFLLNGNTKHYIDIESLSAESLKKYPIRDFIAPRNIEFYPTYFQVNKKLGTTLYYSIEATELTDRVLAEFLSLDLELLISMHVYSLVQQDAIKFVKRKTSDLDSIKIEEQKKAIRAGYDYDILPTDLNFHVEESKKILRELQRENEKYFYLTFTITVFANSLKELDNAIFTVKSLAAKQNCTLKEMKYQQEKAFISSLPFGHNINEKSLERGLSFI